MKFTQTSKTIFFAATLACIMPLHGMDKKAWYENHTVYRSVTPLIDLLATVKANICFVLLKRTQSNKNAKLPNQIIQHKLNQMEKNLRKDEANAIQDLATAYKITNEQFNTITSWANQYKKFEKEYMSQPQIETTHDEGFPSEIFPILEQNGIHPKGISLINSKQPDSNKLTIASALPIDANIEINNDILIISKIITPPSITIYPKLLTNPALSKNKKAFFIHEATHLKEQHPTTQTLIKFGIYNFTNTEIQNHQYFKNLTTIHERQAEILPSLKGSENATIMRNCKSNEYYPTKLFLNHYAQLAEIDELHKLNARLTNYKPTPVQRVDNLRVMRWSINPTILKS